jgi:hypothetical protein
MLLADSGRAQRLGQRSPVDQVFKPAPGAEERDEVTPCLRDGAHPFLRRPRAVVANTAVWLETRPPAPRPSG